MPLMAWGIKQRWEEALLTSTLFLGPGLILAVQLSGRRFSEAFHIGGEYGLSLLWAIVLVMFFKLLLGGRADALHPVQGGGHLHRAEPTTGSAQLGHGGRLPGLRAGNWPPMPASRSWGATALLALSKLGVSTALVGILLIVSIMLMLFYKSWSFVVRLAGVVHRRGRRHPGLLHRGGADVRSLRPGDSIAQLHLRGR